MSIINELRQESSVRAAHSHQHQIYIVIAFFMFALAAMPAMATTYYVDKGHSQASDSNPGTESSPWLTIGVARSIATAGDTVIVKPGVYTDRVSLSNSGTAGNFITYKAEPARAASMHGFRVNGDYIRIEGFEIRDTGGSYGIDVRGDHSELVNNGFYEIPTFAIYYLGQSTRDVTTWPNGFYIADNYAYRCQTGFMVKARNGVIENNEIERCVKHGSGDVDYGRVFGQNIVVKRNWFHGTQLSEVGSAHVDGIQSFTNNGEVVEDIIIEENIFDGFHQGVLFTDVSNSYLSRRITIRNNIFIGHHYDQAFGAWGALCEGVLDARIENNYFYNIRVAMGLRPRSGTVTKNGVAKNNIVNWCAANYNLTGQDLSLVELGHNIVYNTQIIRENVSSDLNRVDPMVVNAANYLGADGIPFTNDDGYRLRAGSPAIDAGTTTSATTDITGTSRPQGGAIDIGPHEVSSTGGGGGGGEPDPVVNANGDSFSGVSEDSTGNSLNVLANDSVTPTTDTLRITNVSSPSRGGSVSIVGGGSTLSYSPASNFFGTETFTYTVSGSGGGSDSATVSVTVSGVNDAPIARNNSFSVEGNSTQNSLNVLGNDSDVDTGDTLSIVNLSPTTSGGTVSLSGGNLLYTPASGFNGTDTFTYTISDGHGGTDTASVTVTVVSNNAAPVASNDSYNVNVNSTGNALNVLANDSDADVDDTIFISDLGATNRGGSVSVSGTQLLYTPASSFTGNESFTYSISDGNGASATASVSVTVNDPSPVAVDDTYTVTADSTDNRFSVLTNDDGKGSTIVLQDVDTSGRATSGTITIDGAEIVYTPSTGFLGTDVFAYSVRNESGLEDTAEVTVNVAPGISNNLCEDSEILQMQIKGSYRALRLRWDNDKDGIPDHRVLQLVEYITCVADLPELAEAMQTAYEINLMIFDLEPVAPMLSEYRELVAALMLLSTEAQDALVSLLDKRNLPLINTYEAVTRDADGTYMPRAIEGLPLSEGFEVFSGFEDLLTQPLHGDSDLDNDSFSNRTEWRNVKRDGLRIEFFFRAATDPTLDGKRN